MSESHAPYDAFVAASPQGTLFCRSWWLDAAAGPGRWRHADVCDADGRLVFSGGITVARGHSGDNAGRSALAALLTDGTAATTKTAVFGCFLRDAVETTRERRPTQRKS